MDPLENQRQPPHSSGAQPPVRLKKVKQRKRYPVAAGMKAVEEVVEYGIGHAGLLITLRTVHKLNQNHGFDCQSCAWPNPDNEPQLLPNFAENGFKAVTYEATTRHLSPRFFQENSVAELATRSDHWLGNQGRITGPLVLRPGSTHYKPIAWDTAFQLIADEIKAGRPNESVFYTSGRTSNETAFLYQLLARAWGTNNLPDCSNMCHESTRAAWRCPR